MKTKIFRKYCLFSISFPENLKIQSRPKLAFSEFRDEELLYRGFSKHDLNEAGTLDPSSIRFPDFSCNWSRFSKPADIRFRSSHDSSGEGVYGFSVAVSKYEKMATPCHDPILENTEKSLENYAHAEVRVLKETNHIEASEPAKHNKLNSKSKKLAYRTNMVNNLEIILEPLL